MSKLVYSEIDSDSPGLFWCILNRPEKLNAFSGEMLDQFLQVLDEIKLKVKSGLVQVVIFKTATQKAFSAGADLSERIKMSSLQVSETLSRQRKVMDGVASLACPTMASVQGLAFGGGMELALSCDIRIGSGSCSMGLTETKLGIIPGAGGTQRLSRIIGLSKAKELIFLGRKLTGVEAGELGILNIACDDPDKVSKTWAVEMLKGGPLALKAAKKAIDGGWNMELSAALDWERKCYEDVLHSQDRIEGLKSFVEKREPKYEGK